MCRLFAFHSTVTSDVRRSLLEETNALREQSLKHADGWGIAWYEDGLPKLRRSPAHAHADETFTAVAQQVQSRTVLAHVRRASVGRLVAENSHPFVHGAWSFIHNGTVTDFELVKDELEARIRPDLLGSAQGDTDSERLFLLFLTLLDERSGGAPADAHHAIDALEHVMSFVFDVTREAELEPSLNLIATDGRVLAATCHGRPLSYTTHKSQCQYREACPVREASCETLVPIGNPVHHLVIASEHIGGPHVWTDLTERDALAIGPDMRLVRRRLPDFRRGLQRKVA